MAGLAGGGAAGAGSLAASVLPIMLSLGGSMVNYGIEKAYVEAQNRENHKVMQMEADARARETARQAGMEREQTARVNEGLDTVNPQNVKADAEAVANDPENAYVAAADEYNVPTLQGQITDGVTGQQIGTIVGEALDRTKKMLRAQSTLTAQDTSMAGSRDATMMMGSALNTLNSARRGSAAVAQQEANIPKANITKSQSILGDALMLAGKAVGGMAGKGAGFAMTPAPDRVFQPGLGG
ncbi:hypothetical protein [uncultured Maritimibacter sp.]|uniref:hypothetical protein n=1 Tax=uncultured Maritimibacter sp. TaxID=991866 RepID=UPI002594AF0B|nr:hypothetical protein [uncultured Maritimibacter sp.]